jgi:hypothetical protein
LPTTRGGELGPVAGRPCRKLRGIYTPFPEAFDVVRSAAMALIFLGAITFCGGCVERTMVIDSNPPGALVYMNDQELGRTPIRRDFFLYGKYDTQVRADGYQTLKTTTAVNPPIYQWIPIDVLAEILPIPFHDVQHFTFTLKPAAAPGDDSTLVAQAIALRGQLESTKYTTTRPTTTRPSRRPASAPATTRAATD